MKKIYENPSVDILQMNSEQMCMTSSIMATTVEEYFFEELGQE